MFGISDQTKIFRASLSAFWLNGIAEGSRYGTNAPTHLICLILCSLSVLNNTFAYKRSYWFQRAKAYKNIFNMNQEHSSYFSFWVQGENGHEHSEIGKRPSSFWESFCGYDLKYSLRNIQVQGLLISASRMGSQICWLSVTHLGFTSLTCYEQACWRGTACYLWKFKSPSMSVKVWLSQKGQRQRISHFCATPQQKSFP